jgi:5'-nucleotidase
LAETSHIPGTLKDINFAKAVFAHSRVDENQHGVDLVLGGHDHTYFVGRGAESWAGYDPTPDEPGTEQDDGVLWVAPPSRSTTEPHSL